LKMKRVRVAVGTENPIKITAVREVFEDLFKDEKIVVLGIPVDSAVPIQPFGEEAIIGAVNRALKSLRSGDADYGVGIEGGVFPLGNKWYNLGFVAIVDKKGTIGTGTSGWFECPEPILRKLKKGEELGTVMDRLTGRRGTKREEGAVGIFTRKKVTRKEFYKHGLYMALIPFLNERLWKEGVFTIQ